MNLDDSVQELPLVGPSYAKRLDKLEIRSIRNLFEHVPYRYLDFSLTTNISRLQLGEIATVKGKVISFKNQYTRQGRAMQILTLSDGTGNLEAVWFNQPFLSRTFHVGTSIALGGTLNWFGRKKAMLSPEYEIAKEGAAAIHTGRLIPIYHETAGLSSKWLRRRIFDAFARYQNLIEEFLPTGSLKQYNLRGHKEAIKAVHFPESLEASQAGKQRLAFNELFFLQLANIKRKKLWQKQKINQKLTIDIAAVNQLVEALPFKLTASQKIAVQEILKDLGADAPMNRLLEGDVGSGKTVVAAIAAFVAFANGHQTIFMAPTQILAQQHFNTFKKLFKNYKVGISLITSDTRLHPPKATQLLAGATGGQVFVGTHALLNQSELFKDVALVVIDEQHKFGVAQRAALAKKTETPHVLTMTATPIPRTVALTFFGDLDLSTLKELPSGRQEITTWIVPPEKRDGAYKWLNDEIKKDQIQVFVVCPLIEESEKETMAGVKAVTQEYENIKAKFPNMPVGLLHGKMKVGDKNKVLDNFRDKKIDILVATPVVEVGIDIPNAAIIVIEASERFGLAQLHQLRGRVGRGSKKSYCLLMTESTSLKAQKRLTALKQNASGFELAELDLRMRGPGEIFGTRQSGLPELKIASWNDPDLMRQAKEAANLLYKNFKFAKIHLI